MRVKISKRFNSSILGILFQNQCEENNIYCFLSSTPKNIYRITLIGKVLWRKSFYIFLVNKNCQR